MVLDSLGGLVVLDRDPPTVLWIDVHGEFRGSAGRAGSRPGGFRSIEGIALGSLGRFHILDGARRIATFEQSDSGFLILCSFSFTLPLKDLCARVNRVFAHTPCHESMYRGRPPRSWSQGGDRSCSFHPTGRSEPEGDVLSVAGAFVDRRVQDGLNLLGIVGSFAPKSGTLGIDPQPGARRWTTPRLTTRFGGS